MRRLAKLAALAFVALSLACPGGVPSGGGGGLTEVPDFALPDLEGRTVRFSETTGKVRLLSFWATWCPPCREEIPTFKELQKTYGERGLAVVAVSMDEEGSSVVGPFVREHEIDYLTLLGTGDLEDRFRIVGYPTTFLVGRDGKVLERWVGLVPKSVLVKEIESALAS